MKILAVAAMAMELKPWLRRCPPVEELEWPLDFARRARWNDADLYAVANGPGPRLAAAALRAAVEKAGPFDALMSVGLCGALDAGLPYNAICCASGVSDGASLWPAVTVGQGTPAPLLSIDRFLGDPEEKRAWNRKGFALVEMEAAAIARYAAAENIPFSAIKAVSDRAADHFAIDFNQFRDESGRFSNSRIALAALRHPIRFAPDVIRMASRGAAASQTLGEFLAQSRF